MKEEETIQSLLSSYLRNELDPKTRAEVESHLATDPTWKAAYSQLLSLSQGIRYTSLRDLQSTLKTLEKTITPSGDLSPTPTYIYTSNETSDLETTPRPHDEALDPKLVQGIRYTSLQDELKKLQKVENTIQGQTGNDTKKNEGAPKGARVVGMKWWAVAAGVVLLISTVYFILEQNKKPKYVNQYLLDHFDEYVLHDKVRAAGDTTNKEEWDRDKEIGYDLYVLQEFEEAIPYLERRWERKRDTLALFYLEVCRKAINVNKQDPILIRNNRMTSLIYKIK